jgi:hypothetical protein
LPILEFGFDVGLQFEKDWKFGLMVRDITTTYNVWNRRKGVPKNCRCGTRTKSRTPESTEITAQKHNWDSLKSLSYAMITVLWLQPMSICALKPMI